MPDRPLTLSDIFPAHLQGLDGLGFFFGAGTSFEAGYPLLDSLTVDVIASLSPQERDVLDEALHSANVTYSSGTPNIETLADIVIAHSINTGQPRFSQLESRLRDLVVEAILSISAPTLDHHVAFFNALKSRTFGLPTTIWIFTTNYDLLFETAAAYAGVHLENGFSGTTHRFFLPQQFQFKTGTVTHGRFIPNNHLTVKLVKLHGSISWTQRASTFHEYHPNAIAASDQRVLILPRRRKVIETLSSPFDVLFTLARNTIGKDCKYLISCGFSFGDEHINQQLIAPPITSNKCRLFVLCKDEPSGLASLRCLPTISGGFESHAIRGGEAKPGSTDRWKFSQFVHLF